VYDFTYDQAEVDPKKYINAAVTQLFYQNNIIHDLFYRYGFDEVSGNFQQNNWGKGGKDKDAVIAHAQDGSGTNNANFATPPDGQPGRMRMYIFTLTNPKRDGDFSNDIVTHEFAHGVSNRLTGGPDNVNCLGWGESGGMGEGWGDWFGTVLQLTEKDKEDTEMTEGSWVLGDSGKKTIRKFKYSTDMKTNPTNYTYLSQPAWAEVHAIGEIWANILYQVYHNLVKATGKFNPDWYSADKTAGNTLAFQIVIDGMKLQPCNPTFVSARDAILKAEEQATGGKYQCDIWKAFAKRGVGPAAKSAKPIVGDFNLPDKCKSEVTEPPKPEEPKPTEPKPEEPKPTEPKPEEPKPTEPKPTEPQPTTP
jgi:extracellular elastinolytic metalloproteinase